MTKNSIVNLDQTN